MVDAIVSYAIGKLDVFLIQEVNIRIGVKDAVIWFKNELSYLQVSLRVLETKQQTGHIRLWIDSVKDVANEAVIVLERFSTHQEEHAAPKQGVLDRMRSCICICKKEATLYDIGKEIESLKERFFDIRKRRDEYKINDILASLSQNQEQRKRIKGLIPFENEVDVVGFEDDVKILLDELVKEEPSLGVISIHGMGGLGKTTLARKLYDSRQLSHFKSRGFVSVSQEYDIKEVLRGIIKSVKGPYYKLDYLNMDELDLLQHLRNILDGDRYLVVIDDIWDTEAWENIKKALPDKKNGSRVIITTRNKEVAEEVDDSCFVHALRFLTEDESWELFSEKAKPTGNLEKLGKEMVGRCRGLPLAIVVLSGLLLHKKSYEDWSDVKDHLWRRLKDKSLKNKSLKIQEILDLSYNDLSHQIKQCFLYLARFPEDYTFKVEKLKFLWIAEEFISEAEEEEGVVMEDVAKYSLNELIIRNMIQIASLEYNGEVITCRIHDLVRDLAIQKAKEHKLMGTFDSSKQDTNSIPLLQGQTRHAIYNGIGEYLKLTGPSTNDFKLRSLAVINETDRLFKINEIKLVFTRFIYLKVLDLTSVVSDGIPEEIGDLVLLTFLGLMRRGHYSDMLVIPATISKLKRLHTLYGMGDYEFPLEICELKQLRHLCFPFAGERMKISIQQTKLQTVEGIRFKDWIEIDTTVNFTNLRTLLITDNKQIADYSLDSIANLTSLQTFTLVFLYIGIPTITPLSSCKRLKTVLLSGWMKDTLQLSSLPDSVTCLKLRRSDFTQDPMPILGALSNLTSLELWETCYHKKMVCNHDAFPNLQFFVLRYFRYLEELQVEDGALPTLKGFRIQECEKLKMISPQLQRVPAVPDIYGRK